MIECENIEFGFGAGFNMKIEHLSIPDNAFMLFAGKNGAGKTSLLKAIIGLIKLEKGTIRIEGRDVFLDEDWKSRAGLYLGESCLMGFLTAKEYLSFVSRLKNKHSRALNISEVCRFYPFCFWELLNSSTLIRNLSIGNQSRIGILGALLNRPSVLLLDEPFAHLDFNGKIALKNILQEFHRTGATIVLTCHDSSHISGLLTHVVTLDKGRIFL